MWEHAEKLNLLVGPDSLGGTGSWTLWFLDRKMGTPLRESYGGQAGRTDRLCGGSNHREHREHREQRFNGVGGPVLRSSSFHLRPMGYCGRVAGHSCGLA